ncbi:MAG: ABC transporter ATP-binding protein [Oscillospiraceae bacterium]|nr:ABC transporter ATP-binding protein [Oscillospiraceae bacterium]
MPKAENICKSFHDKAVLKNFTYEFPEGRITALVGQSGCGKTTLLSIMMGLIKADSGTLIGFDKPISAVFQEDRLCENLTVSANIRLVTGKRFTKTEIEKELCAVGLDGCAEKPVRELSGGMKRRTAIVRAMLADSEILFFDEPFKGLDSDTKRVVIEYVRQKSEGRTVIFVTHDMEECEMLAEETVQLAEN